MKQIQLDTDLIDMDFFHHVRGMLSDESYNKAYDILICRTHPFESNEQILQSVSSLIESNIKHNTI